MIRETDLRIGNYVSDIHASDSFIAKVNIIMSDRVYYGSFHSHPSNLKPIRLTEEIISKTNLTKPKGCEYYVLGSHSIDDRLPTYRLAYLDGKCHISVGTNQHGIMLIILDKLHELQNFHYAVIGEELQVNL